MTVEQLVLAAVFGMVGAVAALACLASAVSDYRRALRIESELRDLLNDIGHEDKKP